jgi:hypothetical protein
MRPQVRYARVTDGYVAYEVVGDGPIDLVLHLGWYSGLSVAERGVQALRGVPGDWPLYAVER